MPCVTCVPFCQLCLVFVTCVHRRVVLGMEGCGMSSTGCVVHAVVYGHHDAMAFTRFLTEHCVFNVLNK